MLTVRQPTLAERLYEPSLVRRLAASLMRRGVLAHAVDDVLQQARLEVWQRFAHDPRDASEVEALFFHVAGRRAIDAWRSERRLVLSEDYDDLLATREAHPEADLREALAVIAHDVADDPQLAQALSDVAEKELAGEEYDDIGRRRNVPPARVRKGVFKLREHVHEHLADYRALIALAVVALVVALVRRSHREEPANDQVPKPAPTVVAPTPPLPTAKERAEQLRGEARKACDAQLYGRCRAALVEARALDEGGDGDGDVQALWRTVERAMAPRGGGDGKTWK